MTLYRIWLSDTEKIPVEITADSLDEARMKLEQMLYEGTLWEETSVDVTEGSLEVSSIERVEE